MMKKFALILVCLAIGVVACGQEVLKRNLELRKTAPVLNLNGSGAVLQFYNGDVSLTQSTNALTLSGGDLALGANNLIMTGSVGATAARITKGWFTNLEITNSPTVNGVSIASIYAPLASPTFTGTVTGTFSGNLTGNVTGNLTGTASLVTGYTRNSGTLTLSGGHGLTLTTTGTTSLTLPTSGTLATNPMSAAGDMIIGGTSGAPSRLAATTNGYVLTLSAGSPVWAAATGGEAIESRIDSIVTVLGDTTNIETLLGIDLDTDTVADLSEVRLRVLRADSTDVFATPTQIADTMTARIAAATVGVAAADSNVYAGYTTRTYVESLLGSGSGLSAQRLPFIVGVTTGAPAAADTIVVHSEFEGKHIDLYRDGAKQYQQFTTTNLYEGFRLSNDTIYVNPAWQANEQVMVDIIEPILWSYLSLEGQESTLLTGLSGYWKLDETSGTIANDAADVQDGTTTASINVTGKLGRAYEFDAYTDYVSIPYNTNISPKGTAFSVSVWFKIDSLPTVTGRGNYIMQAGHTESPYVMHTIEVRNDDNKIYARSRNAAGTLYTVLSTDAISVDTWYHVVFVNRGNGQTLQLYVNGVDVSASAGTFTSTVFEGLAPTYFGNAYAGAPDSYLDGILDSFGIWSKALSSDEVTELYNSGNGKTYPFN